MAGHDTAKKYTDFVSWTLADWAGKLKYENLSEKAIHTAGLVAC